MPEAILNASYTVSASALLIILGLTFDYLRQAKHRL